MEVIGHNSGDHNCVAGWIDASQLSGSTPVFAFSNSTCDGESHRPDELVRKQWANFIETNLLKCGAILFRQFGVRTPDQFEELIGAVCGELLNLVPFDAAQPGER